ADASPADAVVLVQRDLLGSGLALRVLLDDIGRRAEDLAHIIDGLAVGAPHGRSILAVKGRQTAIIRAVGCVADPDIIVGGATIPLAVPGTLPAHVGNLLAVGGEYALLALADPHALHPAARDGHRVQFKALREADASRRGEQHVLAVGRPAIDEIDFRIIGQ